MAPNTERESVIYPETTLEKLIPPQASPRKHEYVYPNIAAHVFFHVFAVYGLYLAITSANWKTTFFNYILHYFALLGLTAGAHRLWSHNSFRVKLPLEIFLMFCNSLAYQNTIYEWVRNHRMHHKYTDTDGDPYNAARGVFFSHMGWLCVKKHPELKKRGKYIDTSDLKNNPVVMFQKKYAIPVIGFTCFIFPTIIPIILWGETLNNAWHVNIFRYIYNLQITFMINSFAHKYGFKPYDKKILSTQNLWLNFLTIGEGFHNYHHVFPWDYRSAEHGNLIVNPSTLFIDFCAKMGWAYDLKTASDRLVKERAKRTGDGNNIWGWPDKDLKEETKKEVDILYPELNSKIN